MKNIKMIPVCWLLGGGSIALLISVSLITGSPLTGVWDVIKKVPMVISVDGILVLLFIKWGWRSRLFRGWLVPFPDLAGTWKGRITSTWTDPRTGAAKPPIDAYLAIKQSFRSITCVVYTEEMVSESYTAEFVLKEESVPKHLVCSYFSKPRVGVRDRSASHDGSVDLSIIEAPPRRLEGEYWTSRKTTGEMEFEYVGRKQTQRFPKSSLSGA